MSKLYEILKKLEHRKGIATLPGHIPSKEAPKSNKKWALLASIFLLSFLLGFGGFYAFKAFLSPKTPYVFALNPKLTEEIPKPKPKHIKTAKTGPTNQTTLATKPEKPKTSPRPPQKRPAYALARTSPEKHKATQEMAPPKYHKELVSPYPPLGTKEILRGLLVRAEGLRREGRCKEAIRLYREYLKHRKDSAVLNNYGACLLLLGDIKEAEKAFKASLRLANDPSTRLNLIIARIKEGNFLEACLEFKKIKDYSNPLYQEVSQILKTRCK